MLALDEDARAARDAGALTVHRDRAAGRPGARGLRGGEALRLGGPRRDEGHGGAVDEEARPEPEALGPAAPVLEVDDVDTAGLLDAHDRADPSGLDVLDDRAGLGRQLDRAPPSGSAPVAREHVGSVPVHHGREASRGCRRSPGAARGRAPRLSRVTVRRRSIGTRTARVPEPAVPPDPTSRPRRSPDERGPPPARAPGHRPGLRAHVRAGRLQGAARAPPPRRLRRHRAQRHGRARGGRPHRRAAHQRRPGADRRRLPALRRPALADQADVDRRAARDRALPRGGRRPRRRRRPHGPAPRVADPAGRRRPVPVPVALLGAPRRARADRPRAAARRPHHDDRRVEQRVIEVPRT